MLLSDFWNHHTVTESGCWEWQMSRSHNGYGRLTLNGCGRKRDLRACRVAWELANSAIIPEGSVVLHSCDNPPCINPSHLSIGTLKENSEDMVRKGRWRGGSPPGEGAGKAVLKEHQVLDARRLYATGDFSYAQLSELFGISRQNIRLAVIGRTWKHI